MFWKQDLTPIILLVKLHDVQAIKTEKKIRHLKEVFSLRTESFAKQQPLKIVKFANSSPFDPPAVFILRQTHLENFEIGCGGTKANGE